MENLNNNLDKTVKYLEKLLEANKVLNLTGADTLNELLERHVKDSLSLINFARIDDNMRVLDMGTGAGFPGIPLAINTDADFVLVDSLNKRISFLEDVCTELEINNVELLHARAEEFLRDINYRETFDIAVSRAVAPLNLLLEYTIPALKVDSKFYAYKSKHIDDEIMQAKNAMEVLNVELTNVFDYELLLEDNSKIPLKILEFTKLKATDDRYPRRVGIPAKRPL